MKPLAIDLFCGLGGWTEGLLAEGYEVVGFDIERHRYPARAVPVSEGIKAFGAMNSGKRAGDGSPYHERSFNHANEHALRNSPLICGWTEYPAQLVLQDVLTLHGRQFKDAALIVASPPCQEYSYMAMPWSRAKAIAAEYRSGTRDVKKLTALFDACFRIQREAMEAAGHFIPLVVENVRGACPWVGRSRWNFGSFHLWGDVPALMPMTQKNGTKLGTWEWDCKDSVQAKARNSDEWFNGSETSIARHGSKSAGRKAASAAIAKIPFPLSSHIARVWMP